jgi:hypothetical protein
VPPLWAVVLIGIVVLGCGLVLLVVRGAAMLNEQQAPRLPRDEVPAGGREPPGS